MRKQDIIAKIGEEVVYRQGGGRGRRPNDAQRAKLVGYYYVWAKDRQYGRNAPATLGDFVKVDEDRPRSRSYGSRYNTNKPGVLVEIEAMRYDDELQVRTPDKFLTIVQPFELFDENLDEINAKRAEDERVQAEYERQRDERDTADEALINAVIVALGLDREVESPYDPKLAEAKRTGLYGYSGTFALQINMAGVRALADKLNVNKETQAS